MNPQLTPTPVQPVAVNQLNGRRAATAVWLAVAAIIVSLAVQYILTVVVKGQQIDNEVGNISIVMLGWAANMALTAIPLSIAAIVFGVRARKNNGLQGRRKKVATLAIVIGSVNLLMLPTLALVLSIIISQS